MDDTDKLIQEKLHQAWLLVVEAGKMAEEAHREIDFMGVVFEPEFGWFSPDGALQLASDWNNSECVIGSMYAEHYGMEGWKGRKFGRHSYPDGSPDTDK